MHIKLNFGKEKKASDDKKSDEEKPESTSGFLHRLRAFFTFKKKPVEQSEKTEQEKPKRHWFHKKPVHIDDQLEKSTRSILLKQKKKQQKIRRDAKYRKKRLGGLLRQAGFETDPDVLHRSVFRFTIAMLLLATVITLTIAVLSEKNASDVLVFYFGLWTAVFAAVYLFSLMVVYVFLDLRIYRRTQELEEVLPDFLQLASANISAGMPIDRALWFAVRPNFGVLAREIEQVAKATLAGEELKESLTKFTERYDSNTLKRSISILLEGLDAGGEIADLLNKIAINIQAQRIQKREMGASVTTYAIFITFASIVMAPALFALGTELLNIIVSITSTVDLSSSGNSMFSIQFAASPDMVTDFKWFSVCMLTISSLMSGSIVSVIKNGRVKDGIRNLPIFTAVSLTIYFFLVNVLHSALGTLI